MLKNILLSILLVSFFLPFVPPGCSDMRNQKPSDSVVELPEPDTSSIKSDSNLAFSDEKIEKENFSFIERVFKYPDNENLSGLGYLIEYFVIEYFLVYFGMLFPLLVFLQRILKFKFFAFPEFWLIAMGFSMFCILAILHYSEVLWGFWMCLGVNVFVIISFFKLKYIAKFLNK